jgi:HAMP domain-containing protein
VSACAFAVCATFVAAAVALAAVLDASVPREQAQSRTAASAGAVRKRMAAADPVLISRRYRGSMNLG